TWRVVDQLGCILNSTDLADGSITLSQPTQVEVDTSFLSFITPDFEVPCKNEAARIQFTASGGHVNGDYDVFLTGGNAGDITAVSADNANGIFVFDLLAANDYQVFVRDGLSCQSATMNFVIREPATLIDTVSTVVNPPVCIGGSTGTISVVATGGTPDTNPANAYTFEIKESSQPDADYRPSDSDNGTSATFSGLDALGINLGSAGDKDYDIRITDANGCDEIFTVTMVPNPTPLELVITNTVDPSCAGGNDGSISVQVFNADAVGDLTYLIKGGHLGTDTLTFDDPGTTFTFTQLQDNQTGLPYTVWVNDDNNCVDLVNQVKDTRLAEPAPVTINTLQARRPSCWDGNDGSIIVKMSGGIAPYQISFENGPFTPVNTADSTFKVFSLEADTYNFRVRDANFNAAQPVCTISKDIVVEPGRTFDFSVLIEDVSCFSGSDGAIDLATDIGNRDEAFDPARLTLTWYRNSPAGQVISNDEDLAAISAGSYFLKAEYDLDSVVCDTLFSYPVLQPASPFVISSFVNNGTTCGISDEGSIRFSVDGGYPGQFAYYNIDNTGWNIISSANKTVIVSGIMAGDHQLEVGQVGNPTDGFECSDSRNFSIDDRAFTIEATLSTPVICNGDLATVTLSSATPDLHYALVGESFENSNVFNLPAGDYQFIARKSNLQSCVSEILNLTITQPDPITIDPFVTQNADCGQNNGTVSTTVSGGSGPITMEWTDLNGNPVDPDALSAGNYQLNVSDSIGCRKTFGPFNIADNPTIGLGYVINTPADCSAANGIATLTITNGTAPFIINDSIFNDPVITLVNLPAIDSVFNVSDARNCPQDITISVP
ncbi:MAG: SprB repeat-containing protein, partial [Bacteroidota bacterium]